MWKVMDKTDEQTRSNPALRVLLIVLVFGALAAAGFLAGRLASGDTPAATTASALSGSQSSELAADAGAPDARVVNPGSDASDNANPGDSGGEKTSMESAGIAGGSAEEETNGKEAAGQAERSGDNIETKSSLFNLSERLERPPLGAKAAFVEWVLANTPEEQEYIESRWDLAVFLQETDRITNERMLEAFLRTPRENFCREWNKPRAYLDIYMRIGYGVTITDPSVVCRMTEAILPEQDQKVLEIGTGSGYQSAILSELTNNIYTIEIIEGLAGETDKIYRDLEAHYPEYKNIRRKIDDGYYGWAEYAPFDRIIVTCAIDHIPPILLQQLSPNGIMIAPIGPPGTQTLLKITKIVEDDGTVTLERADIWGSPVTFVPFKDKSGGKHTIKAQ